MFIHEKLGKELADFTLSDFKKVVNDLESMGAKDDDAIVVYFKNYTKSVDLGGIVNGVPLTNPDSNVIDMVQTWEPNMTDVCLYTDSTFSVANGGFGRFVLVIDGLDGM